MVRKAMRKPAVLAAFGCSNSTFYEGIAKGIYPEGTKLDPNGRIVIWWADEIEAIQQAALDRETGGAPPAVWKPSARKANEEAA